MDMERFRSLAKDLEEKVIEFRHDFHAHPELSWKEERTSKIIESVLKELGFENIRRGFGGTGSGVIADIGGNGDGPMVAIRADIDALPLDEAVDEPWKSTNPGVMHACGHDAHAAILLGVAHVLAALKEELPGKIRLIFQPAEESGFESGAKQLVTEGVLEGVDAIWGLHVWAPLPKGKIGYRAGPAMASADIWEVEVKGKGGHGSRPHEAIDPTIAAATIISSVQTIVSREIDPQEAVVMSVGKIECGTAANIIPETAKLTGNVRTTSPVIRDEMPARIRRIAEGVGSAFRCEAGVKFLPVYPVTVNDGKMVEMLTETAGALMGEDALEEQPVILGSEDFSFYQERIPGAFFFLGMGDPEKGTDAQHHSPIFKTNDEVLVDGVMLLSALAWMWLEQA